MVAGDSGNGLDLCFAHNDGVAADVSKTWSVALHPRIEHLNRVILGHRPGNHTGFGAFAVQKYIHFAFSILVVVGQQLFGDNNFRVLAQNGLGVPLGIVHALNLSGVQGDGSALLQIEDGLRIQNPFAAAFALAVMGLRIGDFCVFAHIKGVDAIVLGVITAAVVDTTSGDNVDLRALSNIEIVVDLVMETAFRKHHGNMDAFVLGKGGNVNVDAVFIGFGFNPDVLRIDPVGLFAVDADVHRAVGLAVFHGGDHFQNVLLYVVQHVPFTSSRLQPETVSARIWG